jgi:hypothetical protein
MFIAWMITRGFDVDRSIKMIGKDYNDPHFEWKDKYVKTRYALRACRCTAAWLQRSLPASRAASYDEG